MNLFKIFIVKYLLGYILQDFLYVLGIFTFAKRKIVPKEYFLMVATIVPISICVRFLPISFGTHTLINMGTIFFIALQYFNYDLYTTVHSTLKTLFLLIGIEIFAITIMSFLIDSTQMNVLFQDPYYKALIYVPFNFIYGFILILTYYNMIKNHTKEGVDGESC